MQMTDQNNRRPLADGQIFFPVKWDSTELVFQEVTGLSSETQVIEYRGATAKYFQR